MPALTTTVLDDDQTKPLEEVAALALSGGGYRAMVFHVGAIYRLNQLGLLSQIKRISSVSGGAMTAGALAAHWPLLTWAGGKATNLNECLLKPVLRQARDTIDVSSALDRFNPFSSPAKAAARSYAAYLTRNLALKDIVTRPQGPLFVFNATSLSTGKLVRFRQDFVADYSVGQFRNVKVSLAEAVAASAAFPPVLSPSKLSLAGADMIQGSAGYNARDSLLEEWLLTDGGVYDNLGTETIWKRCRTLFVSNAGKPFAVDEDPPTDLLRQPLRVLDIMGAEQEDFRERVLVHAYKSGARKGALWGLTTGQYKPENRPALLTEDEYHAVQAIDTRLKAMDDDTLQLLLKAGYAHATNALRSWYGPAQGGPPDQPDGPWPTPIAT